MLSGKCDVESSPASKQYFKAATTQRSPHARNNIPTAKMIGYTSTPRRDFYNQTGLGMRILMLEVMCRFAGGHKDAFMAALPVRQMIMQNNSSFQC